MREGARRNDWTTDEIAYLMDTAGRLSRREICKHLKRSKSSVERMAHRLGLSLRCYKPRLVWCDECATWRTYTNDRTGRCKVCSMSEQLRGRETACAEALSQMSIKDRLIYEESEAKRGTRKLPRRPQKTESCPISMYERKRAEASYLIALEQWEYDCRKLQYDAAKTRLRRMREKSGTNPRKKSK